MKQLSIGPGSKIVHNDVFLMFTFTMPIRCLSRLTRAMADQLRVLYKSGDLLVIDKHFDMKINSNDPAEEKTVDKLLSRQFPESVDPTVEFGFRFAHRLDHATSGVLCIALNKKTAATFQKLFTKKEIVKHYLALVWGHVEHKHILIDIPIGPDSSYSDIYRMCVSSSPNCIQPIRPSATVVVRLETGMYNGQAASKLLLIPLTGRTHQLRVHCCHIGHRIVGDYMYSDRTDTQPPRMMLHSYRIHVPLVQSSLDITAPDYFLSETDPAWQPNHVHITYHQFLETFYTQQLNRLELKFQELNLKTLTLEGIK